MICPVELAHEMSAWRAARIGDHGRYGSVSEGRGGAGDESAGSHVAGDGAQDHVVSSGAEILGITDRHLRRWRERYEQFGFDGGLDRRGCRPSGKTGPLATGEEGLGLYRAQSFDFNVRHFHEKLGEQHGNGLSYTWVKAALH